MQHSTQPPLPSRPPPPPAAEAYQAEWLRTLPELASLSHRLPPKPLSNISIMRSSQLDAARLDEELTSMLKEQFMKIFALFQPGLISRLQPELTLALDFLIFRLSVWTGQPLPGMALMNLRFRNERESTSTTRSRNNNMIDSTLLSGVGGPGLSRRQRVLYGAGAVFVRYAWQRASQAAANARFNTNNSSSTSVRVWEGMKAAEAGYRIAALLNFFIFLKTGRYRTVLERVLGARLVYQRPSAPRALSFEYLNRQLVWHELSELLLFVLPLVNVAAVKRALRSFLPRLPILMMSSTSSAYCSSDQQQQQRQQQQQQEQQGVCGICGITPILCPYTALPCNHKYCYFCLRSHTEADPQYQCPICLVRVEAMQQKIERL
jgi:peroxin-2